MQREACRVHTLPTEASSFHGPEPCRGELSAIVAKHHGARLAPRHRSDCHVECSQENTEGGDPMAEASVLAAPDTHVTEKSRRALWAAAIGNMLEWYDFGVYGFLAGLIAQKFF